MSVINQMLQDLDARAGAASGQAAEVVAKPVARGASLPSRLVLAGGAVAVVLLSVGGALGWRYLHRPAAPGPVTKMAKVTIMARTAAPSPAPAPAAEPAPAAAPRADATPVQAPAPDTLVPTPAAAQASPARPRAKARSAPLKPRENAAAPAQGRVETASQRAEAAYRKALASLQDGWTSEAITSLEQALRANPRHEAARQTLVSLLMENKRYADAMRQLQAALAVDPAQPALAMLLARLQIERGGSGIDTLTRTLAYANGNGDYHAFLAGALQRQGRNGEAATQYQAALRTAPQNGVWWMGLGIALQADKRDSEALEAFRRARSNGLSPELQPFVDRKIQQLGR